jgi:uncharacterized protein
VPTRVIDPAGSELDVACHVAVDYRQTQGMYYLHGEVAGVADAVCHRCLDPVKARVDGEFDVIVRRGEHQGDQGEDVITLASHEHQVPLDPLVHETVVVNVPMIISCREDCRGLCPRCGINLNTGSCTCTDDGDTRWDALRNVKLD